MTKIKKNGILFWSVVGSVSFHVKIYDKLPLEHSTCGEISVSITNETDFVWL